MPEYSKDEMNALLEQANRIYHENFSQETAFERAIFFSWGCSIGDCTFCYMSTQPEGKIPTETRRTTESILAEFLLAKHLGWDIGFFTGGIGEHLPDVMKELCKGVVPPEAKVLVIPTNEELMIARDSYKLVNR